MLATAHNSKYLQDVGREKDTHMDIMEIDTARGSLSLFQKRHMCISIDII